MFKFILKCQLHYLQIIYATLSSNSFVYVSVIKILFRFTIVASDPRKRLPMFFVVKNFLTCNKMSALTLYIEVGKNRHTKQLFFNAWIQLLLTGIDV